MSFRASARNLEGWVRQDQGLRPDPSLDARDDTSGVLTQSRAAKDPLRMCAGRLTRAGSFAPLRGCAEIEIGCHPEEQSDEGSRPMPQKAPRVSLRLRRTRSFAAASNDTGGVIACFKAGGQEKIGGRGYADLRRRPCRLRMTNVPFCFHGDPRAIVQRAMLV